MGVFWKKKKKSDYNISQKIINDRVLKEFLEEVDPDFIKIYVFPAFLGCAYYFGSSDTKKRIEEMIDVQSVENISKE